MYIMSAAVCNECSHSCTLVVYAAMVRQVVFETSLISDIDYSIYKYICNLNIVRPLTFTSHPE